MRSLIGAVVFVLRHISSVASGEAVRSDYLPQAAMSLESLCRTLVEIPLTGTTGHIRIMMMPMPQEMRRRWKSEMAMVFA